MAHRAPRRRALRSFAFAGAVVAGSVLACVVLGASAPAVASRRVITPAPARAGAVTLRPSAAPAGTRTPRPSAAPAGLVAAADPSSATPSPAPSSAISAAMPAVPIAQGGALLALATSRPPTSDGPVPPDLVPSTAAASRDYPAPYLDGCHVPMDGRRPTWSCAYGKTASKTAIVLFGDSHALAWFPAVRSLAWAQGWRLISLTMSACSPADIPQWIPAEHRVSDACRDWRAWALGRIAQVKPLVTLVAGTRGFATVGSAGSVLTGDARLAAWRAGIARTLGRIGAASGRVIYLSDTPASIGDPPACLADHPASVLACATPLLRALSPSWFAEEARAAASAGADFVDDSGWVCPTSPCPATIGKYLVYRDGGHMAATFVATLAGRLRTAVAVDLAAHPPRRPGS